MSEVKLGRVAPIYKGVYDETTAYNALDIVYYNGRSYMAKQDTKGNSLPTGTDNDYWGLIVDKGPQGPKGDKGDKGDRGPQGSMGPTGKDADMPVVGGRNYLFNSQLLNISASKNVIDLVLNKTSYDSNTSMWHITAPAGGKVSTGIYFLQNNNTSKAIEKGQQWAFSFDIKGTGVYNQFGIESSSPFNNLSGNVPTDWTRVSSTGASPNTDAKPVIIYFNTSESPLDVYIKLPKLEIGNVATDWTPAPEDVDNRYIQKSGDTLTGGLKGGVITLPASGDLNDLMTTGKYFEGISVNANKWNNRPSNTPNLAFGVDVISTNDQTIATQVYYIYQNSRMWVRNVWKIGSDVQASQWVELANDNNIVHNTGNETIAGNKTFTGGLKGGETILGDSGDLNMLTDTGKYWQSKTANATNWSNRPSNSPDLAFSVDVIGQANQSLVTQLYRVHTLSRMWVRSLWKDGTTMGASQWAELANDSTVVHNTGNETVAGNKTFTDTVTAGGTQLTDSGWKNMSLASGVTATIARYRLLNGVVYIHVLDINTDVGKVFATLPAGYRPSDWIWTPWYAGGKSGNFLITSGGEVSRASSTTSGTDSGTKASFEVSYPID